MHDSFKSEPNKLLNTPNNKGRDKVFVRLKKEYHFEWEKKYKWYFLELTIK